MASRSHRSLFGTNRGRKARNLLIGLALASFALLMVNNIAGGGEVQATQQEGGFGQQQQTAKVPKYAPPVSDAFQPGGVVDISKSDPANASAYTEATAVATATAIAFGTYNYQQTPAQFVATIPHLVEGLAEPMTKAAAKTWPELVADKVSVTSGASRTPAQITAFDAEAGMARVAVTVTSTVTTASEGTVARNQSYFVDLVRPDSSNGIPPDGVDMSWQVSRVISV